MIGETVARGWQRPVFHGRFRYKFSVGLEEGDLADTQAAVTLLYCRVLQLPIVAC